MTAVDVLREARAAGASVEAEGDSLRVRSRGNPPDDLLRRLREHRDGVLEELRREAAATPNVIEPAEGAARSKSESALTYIPSLGREIWMASDPAEADRLRQELTAEGDARPVIIADDIAKLATLPTEGLVASVRALVAFPGARVARAKPLPDLPEGATGAIYFGFSDGTLIRECVFGATSAEPESEPLVVAAEPVQWSGDADELTAWFVRALADGRLPAEPFQLEAGARVADPKRWHRSLEQDIAAGPRGPRAGVLVEELRRLREIVGQQESEQQKNTTPDERKG